MLVISRRWDRLGARLHAMSNAASVALALGINFKFCWPRAHPANVDIEVNRKDEIFSDLFLANFEISTGSLDSMNQLSEFDPARISIEEAREISLEYSNAWFVDISDPFQIVKFRGESSEGALARFRTAFAGFRWNSPVQESIGRLDDLTDTAPFIAMHIRRGDLIDGSWCQFLTYEKYIPTQFYVQAARGLTSVNRIFVFSDDPASLPSVLTPDSEIVRITEIGSIAGYVTDLQQALLDIHAISKARIIIGPPSSAFSGLGATLAGQEVLHPGQFCPSDRWTEALVGGVDELRACLRPKILSRDVCWTLDVLDDVLPVVVKASLSELAVESDKDFSGAHARRARILSQCGDHDAAAVSLENAIALARSAEETFRDPLFFAICIQCEALGRLILKEISETDPCTPLLVKAMDEVRICVGKIQSIQPFMIPDVHFIWLNLRFQLHCLEFIFDSACSGRINSVKSELNTGARSGAFASVAQRKLVDPLLAIVESWSIEVARWIPDCGQLNKIKAQIVDAPYEMGKKRSPTGLLLADLSFGD